MATITREIASYNDGAAVVEMDYNSTSLAVVAIRVINNTSKSVFVSATEISRGRSRSGTFGPGTTSISIPTVTASRLQLYVNSKGVVDGVEIRSGSPA